MTDEINILLSDNRQATLEGVRAKITEACTDLHELEQQLAAHHDALGPEDLATEQGQELTRLVEAVMAASPQAAAAKLHLDVAVAAGEAINQGDIEADDPVEEIPIAD
jgi:hypothetical protein